MEDKEGKTCPSYYQSTRRHYSEETGGVPMKHKCWDGVGHLIQGTCSVSGIQQGSAEEALEAAYCDLMMGLKFPESTYLPCELSMLHNGND